jgi:hypothetical protein
VVLCWRHGTQISSLFNPCVHNFVPFYDNKLSVGSLKMSQYFYDFWAHKLRVWQLRSAVVGGMISAVIFHSVIFGEFQLFLKRDAKAIKKSWKLRVVFNDHRHHLFIFEEHCASGSVARSLSVACSNLECFRQSLDNVSIIHRWNICSGKTIQIFIQKDNCF